MEWISVNDMIPEENIEVICCFKENLFIGHVYDLEWYSDCDGRYNECDYWMTLPKPPEQ